MAFFASIALRTKEIKVGWLVCFLSLPQRRNVKCFVLCSLRLECACCGQTVIDLNWRCSKSVPTQFSAHKKKSISCASAIPCPISHPRSALVGQLGLLKERWSEFFTYPIIYIGVLCTILYVCEIIYIYIFMTCRYTLFFPCLEMIEAFWLTFFAIMKTWINRAYSKENDSQSKLVLGKINK